MASRYVHLKKMIGTKMAKVGVIGLGYVGLPLAIQMVKSGFMVYGIDTNAEKIDMLTNGRSYVKDVSDDNVRECMQSGRFFLSTDYKALKWLDAISICVPTPLSANQDPDTSYINMVVTELKEHMDNGMLITLESTTYPGTTEELIQYELEKLGGKTGEDFFLCFSPERVDPSNSEYNTRNTAKVLGGTTSRCLELGTMLYRNIVDQVVEVSSTKVAEMSKLLENTFRSVNIAFINEIALMCERMDIDVWEVIRAASTKPFGFMPFFPGPGIGGHCIPLDPMYLSWKAKGYRFYSKFIDLAQGINNTMPDMVVNKTAEILNLHMKSIRNSKVLLLGMAYKPDVDDLRESPGLRIYELFKERGAKVDYYDPYAPSFKDAAGKEVKSIPYDLKKISRFDCLVMVTNHGSLPYRELAELGIALFDTRNAFKEFDLPHIYKLGSPIAEPEGTSMGLAY